MITVQGCKVGFLSREEPEFDGDSGGCFLSGQESEDYRDNPDNQTNYAFNTNSFNTIANEDPEIFALFHAPIGSAFERTNGNGPFVIAESALPHDGRRVELIARSPSLRIAGASARPPCRRDRSAMSFVEGPAEISMHLIHGEFH